MTEMVGVVGLQWWEVVVNGAVVAAGVGCLVVLAYAGWRHRSGRPK